MLLLYILYNIEACGQHWCYAVHANKKLMLNLRDREREREKRERERERDAERVQSTAT